MLTTVTAKQLAIDSFERSLNTICGAFRVEPTVQQQTVQGVVEKDIRAGFEIAHVAKDLQTIRRSKSEINTDDCENFFLIIQEEGRAMMSQRSTVSMLQPGDMVLIDSAEPAEFSFFGHYGRQLSVHLPREEMVRRFGNKMTGGKFLSRRDYVTIAMNAVLAKGFEASAHQEQSEHLREAVLGLLGAWLFEQQDIVNPREMDVDAGGAQLLQNGIAYLDRLFKEGAITVHAVSSDLGVSPRQLQRAFELIGMTPSDYLLQKRLEHACQLLLTRRAHKQSTLVSSIAYASGFNDVSYFNRQFRRHFMCSPSQYGGD